MQIFLESKSGINKTFENCKGTYISKPLCISELIAFPFSLLIYLNWRLITLQYFYGFWPESCMGVHVSPRPEPSSTSFPTPSPLGCSRASGLSALLHASNWHWPSISHLIIYTFQSYSLKSSHPRLLQISPSPNVCYLHLCLFCCLAYRVIVTVFLNFSICVKILY